MTKWRRPSAQPGGAFSVLEAWDEYTLFVKRTTDSVFPFGVITHKEVRPNTVAELLFSGFDSESNRAVWGVPFIPAVGRWEARVLTQGLSRIGLMRLTQSSPSGSFNWSDLGYVGFHQDEWIFSPSSPGEPAQALHNNVTLWLPELARPGNRQELCLAVDFDAQKLWFGVDGWYSGSPLAGTGAAYQNITTRLHDSRFGLLFAIQAGSATQQLLPPSEWSTPGLPGYTSWVQWPTLSGRAMAAPAGGTPKNSRVRVRAMSVLTNRVANQCQAAPNGEWSMQVPPGRYWVLYTAPGCRPIMNGPYLVED